MTLFWGASPSTNIIRASARLCYVWVPLRPAASEGEGTGPVELMPTTLVDWARLYRACGLRRTEEYHGRILINLQIRKKITSEIYLARRIARCLSGAKNGP